MSEFFNREIDPFEELNEIGNLLFITVPIPDGPDHPEVLVVPEEIPGIF